MKILILLLVPFFSFSQLIGKVIQIKDGDTIVILDDKNNQHVIRVADIDCPEYKQPYSKKAKEFTAEQVFKKKVFIKKKT